MMIRKQKKFSASERARHRTNSLIALSNSLPLGHKSNQQKLELVFANLDMVMGQVEIYGEISINKDSEAISISPDGSWFEITPNFLNMCEVFSMIAKDIGSPDSFAGLMNFSLRIGKIEQFSQAEITSAKNDIASMREIARTLTPIEFETYINVIRTRTELERLGLLD